MIMLIILACALISLVIGLTLTCAYDTVTIIKEMKENEPDNTQS